MFNRPRRRLGLRAAPPLLLLATVLTLLVPVSASAALSYTFDVKAHPSVFQEHTEVEVPLYLIENRDPLVDTSQFTRFAAGLRELGFDLSSAQSRIVSFTPDAAFDGRGRAVDESVIPYTDVYENKIRERDGRSWLNVRLYSLRGASASVDASGITGRTELLLGTVRIAVGAHSPMVEGKRVVLDYWTADIPSSSPYFSWWNPSPDALGKNWGVNTGVHPFARNRQTRVFWDGTLENEGLAPGDRGLTPGDGVPTGGGSADGGSNPASGPQAPGVSALGYTGGKLKKAKKASKKPFTVTTKKPKKGTPAVKVTVTEQTSLTASLSRIGKKKRTKLKGERVFKVTSLETYLKLTGSWNKKTLAKGTYQLTLRSPAGTAQTVEFKVT